ncbi:hypothetical protein D9757_010142 [Collybiopsis confluens]|uniref:DUF6593 domain-containing protein n=1 Tax=Collybiopsis confluens TaxID=2823264 RepID=A0A8H5GSP4_9AGAR|nr:hypothetical protein D9757_010142 [Collybiopsis confluens]
MSSIDPTAQHDAQDSKLEQGALRSSDENDVSSQVKLEQPQATPPAPPSFPDGGKEAWTTSHLGRHRRVVGCLRLFRVFERVRWWVPDSCLIFKLFGANDHFVLVFQAYYKENQLSDKSESDIAWIGAFQTFCIYFMGSVFGSIFDKFGAGPLIFLGGVGFSFSCMMQSICVNHWFFKRRGLALGIVTSGSSVGGVIWPIAINRLIQNPHVGFGWALRICGFIALFLTTISALMVKGRLPRRTGSEFFAFSLFRSPAYTTFCIAMFFIVFGIFFLLFYLPSYGAIHGFDANMIFYSVSVLNAASFFGRILPGMAADSFGRYNIMIITGFITALLAFVSIAAKNTASILVVGALYGFTSGNVLSLQGACVPPLLDDPRKIGIGIGQMLSVSGVAALLGPPISGWLIAFNGYKSAQIFSGVMLAFGSIMLVSVCVTTYSFNSPKSNAIPLMSLKLYQQYRNLNNVLNNTYCDDDGKAIYKVHTPITFLKQSTTTISKSLYNRPAVSTVPPADDLGNTTPPETGLDSEETDVQSLASGIHQRRSTSIHESDFEVQKDTGLGVKAGGSDPEVDGASPHGSSDDDDQKNSLNFEYIAQIDWSVVLSSKIRFGQGRFTGQEVLVTKLFRRVGWGWLGRHRAFTGEDGKEYKWRMGHSRPEVGVILPRNLL